MPALFVLLWSTGFIGAKYGTAYAGPNTFLFYRMMLTSVVLLVPAILFRRRWPATWQLAAHIAVAGVLIHFFYLGGVFGSIKLGMPAGLTALIVGLQPLLTALITGLVFGIAITIRQWGGLVLGLAGVALVLLERSGLDGAGLFSGFGMQAVFLSLMALVGITASTLYQKKFCAHAEMVTGGFIQYFSAGILFGLVGFATEDMTIHWDWQLAFVMAWLILVLSIGAVALLTIMMRKGEAHKVASLFYMVPPATALESYLLFDEQLGILAVSGMVLAAVGVYMVVAPHKVKEA